MCSSNCYMPVYVLNIYSDTPDDFTVYNTKSPSIYYLIDTTKDIKNTYPGN